MSKGLYTTNYKNKNNDLVIMIKSGLSYLKKVIENMSEEEKEIEKPNEIVDLVEKFLDFNDQTQREQGAKILIPKQILSKLPIFLAQLKIENNWEKLKKKIRQLLHSWYRLKKLTKAIYNHLINTIQKWKQSLWTLKIVGLMNPTGLDYHY